MQIGPGTIAMIIGQVRKIGIRTTEIQRDVDFVGLEITLLSSVLSVSGVESKATSLHHGDVKGNKNPVGPGKHQHQQDQWNLGKSQVKK